MAWYYVKNGGTATGDGGRVTTQRTGTWSVTASEYYDEIADAIGATTVPDDGDFIMVSDAHNKTGAATWTANANGAAAGAGLYIVSVDNANQENYAPGGSEAGSANVSFAFNGFLAGVDISVTSTLGAATGIRSWRFQDCTLISTSGSVFSMFGGIYDGAYFKVTNVIIDLNVAIGLFSGGQFSWLGGSSINFAGLFASGGADGGAFAHVEGVDLSAASSSLMLALNPTTIDVTHMKFVKCRLHASVTLPSDTDLDLPQHVFEMIACDDSTGADTFRFQYQTGSGRIVNNESVFVTGESTWAGTSDKSSVEVTTTNLCSHVLPFIFELPVSQYVDLADAASNVIRIPITTTLTLTDTEIAAFLMYPDGTTAVIANWVTSGKTVDTGNYGVDPLHAGATLPTSTTAWTGQKTNRYHLELDTSGDAGQAQGLTVRIEVYRASIAANTLMLGTEFELS